MKKYPAKLLLFGEYGLMFGAKALAIPFPGFGGSFSWMDAESPLAYQQDSAAELERFANWLATTETVSQMMFPPDVLRLKEDLKAGLYFESDVPLQYGVGSSGALCAALYDRYGRSNVTTEFFPEKDRGLLVELRRDFVILESYFHGRSSGLDPLVAFLNKPTLLQNGEISLPELNLESQPWTIHLIDTGMTGPTSPLVKLFLDKMEQPEFKGLFYDYYLPANDGAITAFMTQEKDSFFKYLCQLHGIQLEHFREMIPDSSLEFINKLKSKGIFVKLLGSGGGGFLIAFAPTGTDFPVTKKSFRIF